MFKYGVDRRSIVNKNTGGRQIKCRPRLEKWEVSFYLEYDADLISSVQMRDCVDYAGKLAGVLDFRPEKGGPFGRYVVTSWKAEKKSPKKP